jgi:hypothetical protein
VARSRPLSIRSAWPTKAGERGPGGHGGIKRACVTAAMRPARDEMLFAFSNEKGAIPPA